MGARQGGGGEKIIFEMLSDGIAGVERVFAASLLIFLLQREVATASLFSERRRFDAMWAGRKERAVFEAIQEGIESADGGSLVREEASDGSEAWAATKLTGELVDGGDFKQRHKQKGAKQAERVEGRAATRRRRVERGEVISERIEVDA